MNTVKSVLFACNMNSVRSPMASRLLYAMPGHNILPESAGLYPGWRDPFTEAVLGELGIPMDDYVSKTLLDIKPESFDVVVALTPEVAGEVRKFLPREKIEFWPVENPSTETGGQEAVLTAYRAVRDDLSEKITKRFLEIR